MTASKQQHGSDIGGILRGAGGTDTVPLASVSDRIVSDILRLIRSGDLVPGQRLVEADFVARLDVSRGPLREAFSQLAAMGLVELTPHRGARICHVSRREALERVRLLEVVLGLAARLAAEQIDTNDNRAKLTAAAETFMRSRESTTWREFVGERDVFYRTLLPLTDNRELDKLVELMHMPLMRSLIRTVTPDERERQYDYYQQIIDAILAGDGKRAEDTMRRRMREILELYKELPDERFGSEPVDVQNKNRARRKNDALV